MMEPHEFKWGWDAQKKRTHHWPSSEHARRTHRADFAKLIGRKVSVRDGDVMGHGTYLPEERTYDDNIVAPPTVLLRATFGSDVPHDVIHHFENVYPATEVRRGHKYEHPPTHHEASFWAPALSGATWAQEHFRRPREAKERALVAIPEPSAPWKVAAADMEGAMVALFIPEEVGKKIQVDGGEPLDQMHITLVYFDDKADERDDWDKALDVVADVIKKHGPLEGKIGGYGVFSQEKGDVLWAAPDVPGLAELRHELKEALELEGFDTNEQHGWNPHITLKYDWDGDFPEMDEPVDVVFNEVTLARGKDKQHKKLPKVAASMGNWTDTTQLAWEFIQGQEFVMRDLFQICESVGGDFGKIHGDDHIFDGLIEKIMTDPGLQKYWQEYFDQVTQRKYQQTPFYMPSYEEWHDILEGIADAATDPRGGMFLGFGDFDFQPGDTTTVKNLLMPDSSPGDLTVPEDWHTSSASPWPTVAYHSTDIPPEVVRTEGLKMPWEDRPVYLSTRNGFEYGPHQYTIDMSKLDPANLAADESAADYETEDSPGDPDSADFEWLQTPHQVATSLEQGWFAHWNDVPPEAIVSHEQQGEHTASADPDAPLENAWTEGEQRSVQDQLAQHSEMYVDGLEHKVSPKIDSDFEKTVRNVYERLMRNDPRDPINNTEPQFSGKSKRDFWLDWIKWQMTRTDNVDWQSFQDLRDSYGSDFGA